MKTLIRLLFVGLLLGLALGRAWGQTPPHEAVGTQKQEPSGQSPEVASDIPVDDLDRGTPRRAVQGFLQAARTHNYRRAACRKPRPARRGGARGRESTRPKPTH